MINKIFSELEQYLNECGVDGALLSIACNCQDAKSGSECAANIMARGFNGKLSECSKTHYYPDGKGAYRWVSVIGDKGTINIFYDVEVG